MAKTKQPIELVIAKGKKNLSQQEIAERRAEEIKAPCDNIEPPDYLLDELKGEFYRIAKILKDIGIMSDLDCDALARYVAVEHQYQQVTHLMLKRKQVDDRYFDLSKLQTKFFRDARAAASDLGLTISSRCKLIAPVKENKEPPKANKFNRFVK
ncbi:MAG: phage terminase small subunit P27 family [Filifactoraceae bacterium]